MNWEDLSLNGGDFRQSLNISSSTHQSMRFNLEKFPPKVDAIIVLGSNKGAVRRAYTLMMAEFADEEDIINGEIDECVPGDTKRLSRAFTDASNKAIKKSQQIGAEKMKDVMGGLGGMFGE